MKLETGGDSHANPSADLLAAAIDSLDVDDTLTLLESDEEFLDAIRLDDTRYGVQFREGGLEDMWSDSGSGIDKETLKSLFMSYLSGDGAWRTAIAWERSS